MRNRPPGFVRPILGFPMCPPPPFLQRCHGPRLSLTYEAGRNRGGPCGKEGCLPSRRKGRVRTWESSESAEAWGDKDRSSRKPRALRDDQAVADDGRQVAPCVFPPGAIPVTSVPTAQGHFEAMQGSLLGNRKPHAESSLSAMRDVHAESPACRPGSFVRSGKPRVWQWEMFHVKHRAEVTPGSEGREGKRANPGKVAPDLLRRPDGAVLSSTHP